MNYIKQLNTFYKLLPNNPLSSNAQCLYNYLLNKNNELGWIKEFTVSNMIVCGFTCLSRQALDRARNELKQKGYIEYTKGVSNQAGKYLIVCFGTQDDTHDNTQDDTQDGHTASILNKLNKTKQQKESNTKKFVAPSLEDVEKYVAEKKLKVDAKKFFDYFTEGNWIDSKGNKVKNWKQKILTWNGYSKDEIKASTSNTYHAQDNQYTDLSKFYSN